MTGRMLGRRRFAGFTLIELLIVVIIIGILIAIGVPAYLKYTASANDRDAQSSLMTAYKAAVAGDTEVNSGRFPVAATIVADIGADEPSANVARGSCIGAIAAAPVKQVLVDPASSTTQVTMCARSASGTIWKLAGPLTGSPVISDGSQVALAFTGAEITDALRAAKTSGDGLAADSSTGVWESTTNLVPRSSFDGTVRNTNPPSGWFTGADAANGASVSISKVSDFAFPVDNGSVAEVAVNHPGAGWAYVADGIGTAPFTVGQTYTVSFWADIVSGSLGVPFTLVENSDGTNVVMAAKNFTPTSSPQRFSFTFTAASTGNLPVVFVGTNAGANGVMHITGVQVEQKAIATPYVPTSGVAASRPYAHVQAPSSLLTAAQGWFAIRFRAEWPAAASPSPFMGLFDWRTDASNRLAFSFEQSSKEFRAESIDAGANTSVHSSAVQTFVSGDQVTAIYAWTPTSLKISSNGGAFSSLPRPSVPSISGAVFDVGAIPTNLNLDGEILWIATGTGVLTDTDAATISSWGSNDPKRSSFPASAQATMAWDGTSSSGSLK